MSEFYTGLAEILEIDESEVTPAFLLPEDSWDSLAVVSTIALIDEVYDKSVKAGDLAECKTVADIERLVAA